ncbi:MAG: polysaccharide deacetylase [Candidatus Rokubacteria bacterium RIFCSPLOWO2_12_FULL_71_22]|nr:MAG: polysaccharide deacetylase [Candidatus Rokubacteria bacterium RIFCSPLOWO2_02_FULL_72_37]OGL16994.1 MAG: polysaccharide deacetylase [Candidatus Rokubacteria bacterium RIFCSPLOWO2_12_FULL_71_22]
MTRDLLQPTDRVDYVPITRREPLPLPDGARIVVWPCVNVEHWVIDEPMPRTVVNPPGGIAKSVPDIPNWAWHEYGQRVGFWRIKRIFDDFGVAGSLVMNASVCDAYPQIVDACMEAGWDTLGHGYVQKALPAVPDQREMIHRVYDRIKRHTGKPPRGWLSPALAETHDTVDWLHEAGFEYVADWVLDDQPVDLRTKHGVMVSLPYTQELNDVAMILIQGHRAAEYADRAIDQFEQLLSESAEATRLMCFTLHPYIMGVAHRAKHVRRIFEHVANRMDVKIWTGAQILDWYLGLRGRRRA